MRLDAASAGRLAALALACVGREFPNQPGHVMQRAGELDRPRSLHPAFFGCFDWHSAVHGTGCSRACCAAFRACLKPMRSGRRSSAR